MSKKEISKIFDADKWHREKGLGDFYMFYDKRDEAKLKFSEWMKCRYLNDDRHKGGSIVVKSINDNINVMYSTAHQ